MEGIDQNVALIGISLLVILSYIFNLIAKKLRVPSVLLLIGLGVAIHYSYDLEHTAIGQIDRILPLLGKIGVIMIVLEAALDLHLSKDKRPIIIKSVFAALIILVLSSLLIATVINSLYHVNVFFNSLFYAISLSVVSSAIVIPSVHSLAQEKKEFMIYESTFSDVLGILFFNVLITISLSGGNSVSFIGFSIFGKLLLTILIAIVFISAIIFLFHRIKTKIKLFLIIAILTMVYAVGEEMALSSLIIIFFFGLAMNNLKAIFRGSLANYIRPGYAKPIIRDFKIITAESAFIVRTFFFVIFGYSIDLSLLYDKDVILVGSIIVLVLYMVRLVNLAWILRASVLPEIFLSPRGLITILLYYHIPEAYKIPGLGDGVIIFVVLATTIIMMLGLIFSKSETAQGYQDLELGSAPSSDINL